jgi:hypothetical protein
MKGDGRDNTRLPKNRLRSKSESGLYLYRSSQEQSDGDNNDRKVDFSIERKVELLFKKYKVMEDRWKKSEKDLAAYRQSSTEWQSKSIYSVIFIHHTYIHTYINTHILYIICTYDGSPFMNIYIHTYMHRFSTNIYT